jgi:proline dehydrogenase
MIEERLRSREKGYPSPVHDTIEETHLAYNTAVGEVLKNIDHAGLVVASHNVCFLPS